MPSRRDGDRRRRAVAASRRARRRARRRRPGPPTRGAAGRRIRRAAPRVRRASRATGGPARAPSARRAAAPPSRAAPRGTPALRASSPSAGWSRAGVPSGSRRSTYCRARGWRTRRGARSPTGSGIAGAAGPVDDGRRRRHLERRIKHETQLGQQRLHAGSRAAASRPSTSASTSVRQCRRARSPDRRKPSATAVSRKARKPRQ